MNLKDLNDHVKWHVLPRYRRGVPAVHGERMNLNERVKVALNKWATVK